MEYRILQRKDKFYPQYRKWLRWHYFHILSYCSPQSLNYRIEYGSLERAKESLAENIAYEALPKKIIHEIN